MGEQNALAGTSFAPGDASASASASPSQQELDQIWRWNASVPNLVQGCVHDLITEIADRQPDAVAVCAWDGNFTYSQLDLLANKLGRALIQQGIEPKSSIPILFSKSRWTCVAMLGVIKAGCSAIALDATQPDTRLQSIVQQAQPTTIISSAMYHTRARQLTDVPVFQLDDTFCDTLYLRELAQQLPVVSPSDTIYISFTSYVVLSFSFPIDYLTYESPPVSITLGSPPLARFSLSSYRPIANRLIDSGTTGQPKGACISHANVRSAIRYQGSQLGFHRESRVFDFAPYSFDVAWSNFLHTLCAGGCLCIASEEDMLSDLSSAIASFQATLINITPTVLRTISVIPESLQTVLLSGEMPYPENVTQWAQHVRLLNTYGPTECTFKCAFSLLSPSQQGRPDIGKGVGFSTWVVDPTNTDCLVSIGSVGELLLEGPLVGQGYLSDPDKTASAFVNDPPWLLAGNKNSIGRCGRLYKTGDLVKYKSDGRILFVGRKDASQLKIRGQRVEVGDVEHHVRASLGEGLPALVDVIVPRGSDSTSLALFVMTKDQESEQVKALMDGLAEKLRTVLPAFMIPNVYFPIHEIPVASTGKVDRRRLREMGNTLTWNEIIELQSSIVSATEYHEPSNLVERQLRQIWSKVLGLNPTHIGTADSFLRLGGDSIGAMRVVAAAREKNLLLTVADLFRTPVLRDLAEVTILNTSSHIHDTIVPFSLLTGKTTTVSVCNEASRLCGVEANEIEDVYPCTPLQQGMLAVSAGNEGMLHRGHDHRNFTDYISRTAFELPRQINIDQFKNAWAGTVECATITRTRIIDLPGEGLVQVVIKQPVLLDRYAHIGSFFERANPMGLGTPLFRAGIVDDGSIHFVLEMHHAIFDGWSAALILDTVEAAYRENHVNLRFFSPFEQFIRHVSAAGSRRTAEFWRDQFAGSEAVVFPSPDYHPETKIDLHHRISGLLWPHTGITPSSVVHSALSLLLASYTNSNDVKYGATLSGRGAPVPGIERIAGPTIATVPVRVKFDWDQTVATLQQQIQRQAVDINEHEQFGLQSIRRIDEEVEEASQFQLLLVVQPAKQGTSQLAGGLFSNAKSAVIVAEKLASKQEAESFGRHGAAAPRPTWRLVTKEGQTDAMGTYNSYAVMIICQLEDAGLTLKVNFDSGAIEKKAVQRIAQQLEHLIRQLSADALENYKLRDIITPSNDDLAQIWDWNKVLPDAVEEPVTTMIDSRAVTGPNDTAVSAWDKKLSFQQLKNLTICLAGRLHEEGIGPGSIVVLSFEKSAWLIISMLSVLKVGAVALPISAPTSNQRAREIVEAAQPKLVITSSITHGASFQELVTTLAIFDLIDPNDEEWPRILQPNGNPPSNPALILFTSGSTGAPKSILWTHKNLSSNIRAHGSSFGVTANSRVFQFSGYEFDVSTVEALSTLSAGGCLCIPSESDRTNRLTGAINDARANWLCLTPSVSETLSPEELPLLGTLVLTGEKLSHKVAFKWAKNISFVYNWYGPAEASVTASYLVDQGTWTPGVSGRSIAGLTWLVSPGNPNILAPIGAIAELCVEGPIVASYTGETGMPLNEKSFCSPPWLLHGCDKIPGRRGRLYRTGDLVRYSTDGQIIFIGRMQDTQRKLRGQRVELGEIELRVQMFLSGKLEVTVIAEIFSPANSNTETLALFISSINNTDGTEDTMAFIKRVLPVDDLETYLLEFLPSYMIPKVYVPIDQIPMTRTGKTDRRGLRQIGSSFTYEMLAAMQPSRREGRMPSTEMEKRLQSLWAEIIGIETSAIHATDSFLRLGGDSIQCMRLVALARKQGLLLTVADVFEAPQLENMVNRIKQDFSPPEQEVSPFSLLGSGTTKAEARSYAARMCSIPDSRVVDMYPCTSLQQGLLALGARKHGRYVSRSVLELQPGIDPDRLRAAWYSTVEKLPLLRTRIIDLPGQGFVQVVLDDSPLRSGTDINAYVRQDEHESMGPGTELCRASIIDRSFILTIHHCTYDGTVLRMILDELELQYLGEPGMVIMPFKSFIQHLNKMDPEKAAEFWRGQLSNSELPQFPVLPSARYEPQANEELSYPISLDWPRTGVTPSTIIRSAWVILATQYTSSRDVAFAVTVNGRQTDMRGVENCAGPTISTVPMVVSVDWDETIEGFLGRLQRQMIDITPYEQYGLQNIQRLRQDLDPRVLQTLLVVQPVAEGKSLNDDSLLFKARSLSSSIDTLGTDPFNNYALMVVGELTTLGLQLRMSFDSNIIDRKQISRMMRQFETVLRQFCLEKIATAKLGTMQTASDSDLDLFWAQNAEVPEGPTTCVHELIALAARTRPKSLAIDSWDGQFTYEDVEELSGMLCQSLLRYGVTKGSIVALNFEKSKWAPVAYIAVLKAGAAAVQQSTVMPDHRMAKVFKSIGVILAIVSEFRLETVSQYVPCFTIDQLLRASSENLPVTIPVTRLGDSAAVLVSSGSTGEPKQVLWSHRTLTANVKAHGEYLGVTSTTRLFQFASYDFDVSTIESISTLVHMGCLCIPSESERLDGTTVAINRFGANFMNITPSTAKALRPEDLGGISTLVLSGENVAREDVDRWKNGCRVLNWYGPAEHPATSCAADAEGWYTGVFSRIDLKQPALCWIVDLMNPNRLVPFGALGEIVLEGPLCAEGYIANPAMTEQRFRSDLGFLSAGHGTVKPGSRGLIYCSGDLGKYDTDGNLVYMGRKDTQLKIRGQLVAPEEVQLHIRQNLESAGDINVVVDAIRSHYSTGIALVAFLDLATEDEIELVTAGLDTKLKKVLPAYAIPAYYIPVPEFPMNASAKIDRKRLREIGASFDPSRQGSGSIQRKPTTIAERKLRDLWSLVLGTDADTISTSDSFLRISDSIGAMRLVGMARQQGLLLTVAEVFESPILEEMAKVLKNCEGEDDQDTIAPFTILNPDQDVELARQCAASLCGVQVENIEDMFPCTPLQEGLLALTMKREGDYTGRNIMELAPSIDLAKFKEAWNQVVMTIAILRTRIIDLPGQGLVQVVIRRPECWLEANGIDGYLRKESELSMGLGSSLMRCALFVDGESVFAKKDHTRNIDQKLSAGSNAILGANSSRKASSHESAYFALTMHHSIYDGLTMPLILKAVENLYTGVIPLHYTPFQSFVKYINAQDKDAAVRFWNTQFLGLKATQFPALQSSTYQPRTDKMLMHSVEEIAWREDNITPSTVIRAATALLCSQYSSSSDVVFGAVSSGRKAPVAHIETLTGPTIATVPVRVDIDTSGSFSKLLVDVQKQEVEMISYEQTGLSRIRQMSDEAQQACQFQTLLVVQSKQENVELNQTDLFISESRPGESEDDARQHGFQSYALSLICTPGETRLTVRFCFDSVVIEPETIRRMARGFEQLLRKLCSPQHDRATIGDIGLTSDQDLDEIWKWNSTFPRSVERCVHDLITEVAQTQPDAIAVSAWDGELTYGLLDRITSKIACRLTEMEVGRNTIIPLCFEKSMFALVAFLSVIKAGGAGLLLDTTIPESRLRPIVQKVESALILSSPSNELLARRLVSNTLVLGPNSDLLRASASDDPIQVAQSLIRTDPSDLLCAIFTSGSTGTPKGCLLEHRNFSSAVSLQRSVLQLDNKSRMYDFASHAFDATYWSAFHVLAAGGTLCIPSDAERKSDLTESIRRFHTTDLFLTPSVAHLVDAAKIPTLRSVHLGGEEVKKDDVARWMPYANTFVAYGPSECSAGTLYYKVPNPMPSRLSIGKGVGASTWIVDPRSSEQLAPIGTIGELYLEGPLIGRGYLGDEKRTASTFIKDPAWLLEGSPDGSVPGRNARLYKTGDLAKYNPADGTIIFVGRKDTQVKLRGQRVELAEVEYHVQQFLTGKLVSPTCVAEVVVPDVTRRPMLVVFIQLRPTEESELNELLEDLENNLRENLPSYMVPDAYIPIESIPLSASGKSDRRRLREIGGSLNLEQLSGDQGHTDDKLPTTDSEFRLQQLWTTILGISADKVRRNSNFMRLGGDSISAMRLAALARTFGISLAVQDILQTPRFCEMTKAMTSFDLDVVARERKNAILPFSLLKGFLNKDAVLGYLSRHCNVKVSQIEDAFPCTSVQKSLLSMTAKFDNSYVSRFSMPLWDDVDIGRLKKAWEDVSRIIAPILRYRILDVPTEGLIQVQLKEAMEWDVCDNIDTYLALDQSRPMGLGTPLTRLAIIGGPDKAGEYCCFVTQHHAIYDGYSMNLLIKEVSKSYAGVLDSSPVVPFQAYIKYVVDADQEKAIEFWRQQFANSEAVPFPALPTDDYRPKANSTVRRDITNFEWPRRNATASTILRAAWSILTAHYTATEDVVFGAMVTGRQASLAGIDRMIAPLISAVPVRVKFNPKQSVAELLSNIQQQSIEMIAYEQTDLLDIRRINPESDRASRFNTLLVVQPADRSDNIDQEDGPFRQQPGFLSSRNGLDDFNPNAVMIMCQLTDTNGLRLEVSFDSNVIDPAQMGRISAQFEHVLRQICISTTQTIENVETISQQDIRELWTWNATVPEAIEECVHDLIGDIMKRQPQAPAICAWDGSLSYTELDDLSSRLASHLTALGAGPGAIIPLCFEKSMWYPVAALGAMKAGAACVAMDSTQPESRLRSIVKQTDPRLVLSSASNAALASRLSGASVVVVDRIHIQESFSSQTASPRTRVCASDVLYVVFTSGSTGMPKGIVTTHGNFSSAAMHQAKILNIQPGTRVFDFVSYSFDVSWSNHLQTLICGGCLCIPSEAERRNNIASAFSRMKCDYVYFTPSVAQSLEPSTMMGIKTLAMGGEPIPSKEIARWKQAGTMIGIYGPAECAQALSFAHLNAKTRNGHVGHSYGARTWLVQPGRPDRLAAVGTIAELAIEGPTVSKEYFGDVRKTSAAYIQDPLWLVQGAQEHPGRTGRLYLTGDLLRYNSDGSLDFIGRKDGMIKLRGQRIELAEVEYHVRSNLCDPGLCEGLAAEIITPQNSTSPLLAVFLSLAKEDGVPYSRDETRSRLMRVMEGLEEKLWDRVPQYMVPGAYIHIDTIPMTSTNKTDRRALREFGSAKTLEQLAELQPHSEEQRAPSTDMEKRLQALWSSVLDIQAGSITAESSFLRIGGESIAAMRLVSAAREQKLSLTFADIFKSPRLSELALLVQETITEDKAWAQAPFSLVGTDDAEGFLENVVVSFVDTSAGPVKDVIPATDFQELSVMQALQDPPIRYPHWIFDLPADVDFSRLEQACRKLVTHFDILHTVFVQGRGKLWQVLLPELKPTYDNLDATESDIEAFTDAICKEDLQRPRKLGHSFIRFIAIKHFLGQHKLVFRISHAHFDGFSWGIVLQTLSSIYSQEIVPAAPAFSQYIAFKEKEKEQSLLYWASRLRGSTYPSWVTSGPADRVDSPGNRLTILETVPWPDTQRREGISAATIFHAACAMALSRQFSQREVIIGRLVTGRSVLPSTLQHVVGPTMTEVPIRIDIDTKDTVAGIALRLQSQFIEDAAHEAAGMVQIIRNCTDWSDDATDFGWRTAFQQEEDVGFTFLGEPSSISFYQWDMPPRSRPEIYATPKNGNLDMEFEGNKRFISEEVVRGFFAQLRAALGEY